MEIKKTKNYSLFKKNRCNRDLLEESLKKLRNSILSKNLLEFRPILVNRSYEVIDGQHRLEVAKELKLDIYYQIEESASEDDILLLNINQTRWKIKDYLNYYINLGKEEYSKLNNYMNRNKLKDINITLSVLHGYKNRYQHDIFKEGKYIYPTKDEEIIVNEKMLMVEEIIRYIREKSNGDKQYLKRTLFLNSLIDLAGRKGFSFEIFMQKLPYGLSKLHPCSRKNDYLILFKEIYNYKNQNPLEIT